MAGETTNGNSDGDFIIEESVSGGDSPTIDSPPEPEPDHSGDESEDDSNTINPGDIIGSDDATDRTYSAGRRKRSGARGGSRKSTYRSTTKKEASADISTVMFSIHLMLSKLTGVPELELDKDESKRISDAAARVNEFYGNYKLPEELLVWIGFGTAATEVYLPRFMAYGLRKKKEAKEKKAQVITMPNPVAY